MANWGYWTEHSVTSLPVVVASAVVAAARPRTRVQASADEERLSPARP